MLNVLAEAEKLSTCVVAFSMFTPLAVCSCSCFAACLECRSNRCFYGALHSIACLAPSNMFVKLYKVLGHGTDINT